LASSLNLIKRIERQFGIPVVPRDKQNNLIKRIERRFLRILFLLSSSAIWNLIKRIERK